MTDEQLDIICENIALKWMRDRKEQARDTLRQFSRMVASSGAHKALIAKMEEAMSPKYDTEPDESTLDRLRLPDEITDESGRKWVHFGYGWDADTGIISDRVYTTAPAKEQHDRDIHKSRVFGPNGLGTWRIPEGVHHLDSYPEHNIIQTAPCNWPHQ